MKGTLIFTSVSLSIQTYFSHVLFCFLFLFLFFFLGLHPWHMEVPRLGVKSELQLPAYTTATATQDLRMSETYTRAHGNTGSQGTSATYATACRNTGSLTY